MDGEHLFSFNCGEELIALREDAKKRGIPVLRESSLSLLTALVAAKNPKNVLEIGTAIGASGIAMLSAAKEARLTTIELEYDFAVEAKKNFKTFGFYDRVTAYFGDASDIVPKLEGNFDFIFLDGPKGHYYEYLPYLKNLLNKGGVIFADNVLFKGYVEGKTEVTHKHRTIYNSLLAYLTDIKEDKNYITAVLDVEDGICISVKVK